MTHNTGCIEVSVNMAVVFNNITRLSRCKTNDYLQIIRRYSNVKYTKPVRDNSYKLLGVLSGGLAAISYVKWRNTSVVEAAFNPKKLKVCAKVIKILKINWKYLVLLIIDCLPEMCKYDA